MATNVYISSGSPVIGSPITVKARSAALSGTISFHNVKFVVYAGLDDPTMEQSDSEFRQIDLSESVTPEEGTTEEVMADISSALRAVADKYIYSPEPPVLGNSPANYPTVRWKVEVYDEYMVNGNVLQTSSVVVPLEDYYVSLFGRYSELERLVAAQTGFRQTQLFSRKPTSTPEIVAVGETVVCPRPFAAPVGMDTVSIGTTSTVVTIVSEGMQSMGYVDDDNTVPLCRHQIYALPADNSGNRYQFRFINGMGCLESFSALCLRAAKVSITSQTYARSRQETFGQPSGVLARKQNNQEVWSMSTGQIDEDWAAWFAHEVFMSPLAWILLDGRWIPCEITSEDPEIVNRAGTALTALSFEVKLSISGSPVSGISI